MKTPKAERTPRQQQFNSETRMPWPKDYFGIQVTSSARIEEALRPHARAGYCSPIRQGDASKWISDL